MTTTATETGQTRFAPGTRVRLTDSYNVRSYVLSGHEPTGTILDPAEVGSEAISNYAVVLLDHPVSGGAYGEGRYAIQWHTLEAVESESASDLVTEDRTPVEETVRKADYDDVVAELARVRQQRDRALSDLATFRTTVRDKIIEEAEARDWCSEADDFLESLGLEGREYDYTVMMTVTVTVPVSRTGSFRDSDDAAESLSEDIDGDDIVNAIRYGSYSIEDVTVDEVERD